MKLDEAQLVAACRNRDPRACRQLYDAYAPAMFGFCLSLMNDRESAQDVLHDGFIKVFENLHKLRSNESLGPWIHRIMENTATDHLRLRYRTVSIDDVDTSRLGDPNWDALLQPYGGDELVRALHQLPEVHRQVFILFEVEGYTDQELADRFNLKPASVRCIITRSRKRLIEILTTS